MNLYLKISHFALGLTLCSTLAICTQSNAQTAQPGIMTPPGTYLLRLKFVPGTTRVTNMNMSTNMGMNIGGRSIPMVQKTVMQSTETVKSVDSNGNGTVETSIIPISVIMNDSVMPMDDATKSKMSKTIERTESPDGKVISANLGDVDTSQFGSPDMFKQGTVLPDYPVKIGDSWRGAQKVSGLGITVYSKYTLLGVDAGIARIQTKFFFDMKSGQGTGKLQNASMTANGTGTESFDIDGGAVIGSGTDMSMAMKMPMPTGAPGAASGQSMDMNMKMSMTLNQISVTSPHAPATPATPPTPATPAAPSTPPASDTPVSPATPVAPATPDTGSQPGTGQAAPSSPATPIPAPSN